MPPPTIRRTLRTTTTTPSSTTRIVCCVGYTTTCTRVCLRCQLLGMIIFHGYSSTSCWHSKNKYAAQDAPPESLQRSLARAVQKEPSKTILRSSHAEVNAGTNEQLPPQPRTSALLQYSSSLAVAPTTRITRHSPISRATLLTADRLVVRSLYPKMERMNQWPM